MKRKYRTYYQQVAAAVSYEKRLNATLIKVTREHGKANFTFKHNKTKKVWRTTLSKLENYKHNSFKEKSKKATHNYWEPSEWRKAAIVSKHFDSFKVYIIKCTKGKETFYKIGRTFNTVSSRFSQGFPYEYKVVRKVTGSATYIWGLERRLHVLNEEHKYIPKIPFSGSTECFSTINKETYAYFK